MEINNTGQTVLNLYILVYSTLRKSINNIYDNKKMQNPKTNNPEELMREIMTFFQSSDFEKKSNKINLSKAPFHLQTVTNERGNSRQQLDLDEELSESLRYINVIFGKKISEIELKLGGSWCLFLWCFFRLKKHQKNTF